MMKSEGGHYNTMKTQRNPDTYFIINKASRGALAQNVTVKPTVVGSIPTRGDEIFIKI